jgi:hypothetical protein
VTVKHTGLPALPARADSIVALSARRLVCAAIFEITPVTEPIFADDLGHAQCLVAHRTMGCCHE